MSDPFNESSHQPANDPFQDPQSRQLQPQPTFGVDSNPFESRDSFADLESGDNPQPSGGNAYGGRPFANANTGAPGNSPYGQDYDRRERELREREEAVRRREGELEIYSNNWPPYFPFLHHDIKTLPNVHQQTARFLYFQWLALILTLVINLLGCIFLLIAGSSEGGADTGAAGGYVPFIGIASFILWYRPIYLGLRKTEGKAMAFFFYIYFLFAGFHLLFSIYMAIGIPCMAIVSPQMLQLIGIATGSAGLINTISMLSQAHFLAGVFGAISSAGWIIQATGGGILYKKIWDYKNGNAEITFQEATNQFKSNSIRNILMHQARMS